MVNSPLLLGTPLPDFMVKQLAPPGTVLQAVGVGEVFLGYMQIALIIGVIFAMPVVVYQLVAFFSPGLLGNEKRMVYIALPIITELFLAGVSFGWFFTVPAALQFLLQYGQTSSISTVPTSDSFFQTVSNIVTLERYYFSIACRYVSLGAAQHCINRHAYQYPPLRHRGHYHYRCLDYSHR
jgi:sec-independent protein translocase protein TatC